MTRLDCTACGHRLELPPGFAKAKLRCEACGYYTSVPEKLRNAAVPEPELEPVTPAVSARPAKAMAASPKAPPKVAPPLLAGTDDEDDGMPYAVPGDATQKCSACNKELPLDATFCVHCGIDFASKKKKKKKFEAVDKSWEPRWPFELRLKVLGGLQVVNLLLAIFLSNELSLSGGFSSLVIQAAIQALIIGTFEKLTVRRTGKGTCTIEKTWRVAFYPMAPKPLDHKESQGVGIIATQNAGFLEWFTMIYLCLFLIVPGLLFYWYIIRPDRFNISLCDVYGSTNEIAFRTTERAQAEEICETIRDCAGLWYKPVL
ncbi:hypothetical protein BH11PLA2_BH11PLA2_00760 [soil metagenome]